MVVEKSDPNSLPLIANHLKGGDLVIMPCDTIYGIVGVVDLSLAKLNQLKGRGGEKHFIQLVTLEMANSIARCPIDEAILSLWPAPLTVIVADIWGGTTAIRVPADAFLIALLELVGKPLYTTSVNLTGEPFLNAFDQIYGAFKAKVSLFVRGEIGENSLPSTILDTSGDKYKIIRQGSLDLSDIIIHNIRD
ncbi:MAG: L-threonylcarbamoyladenylate synthase [Sphaerochaetaceae bacterium]|jgi:L-threonylcarbamoyladenylate synthase|nr:L-threonylcarbamoyladenylate synthase [Spirochaetales bacterium]